MLGLISIILSLQIRIPAQSTALPAPLFELLISHHILPALYCALQVPFGDSQAGPFLLCEIFLAVP